MNTLSNILDSDGENLLVLININLFQVLWVIRPLSYINLYHFGLNIFDLTPFDWAPKILIEEKICLKKYQN